MDLGDLEGLPDGTGDRLRELGIDSLYPPQVDAVEKGALAGENLVASVPTASGKTLIAVFAMLAAIDRGGTALYIVPLRALASEKRAEFDRFASLGIDVGLSTGNYESTDDWLATKDIVVATSEKVDSLIRNGATWIDDLTCVVADEVHLVDDANRGPTLEVTLAKLRHHVPDLQIVALSATIGNADDIARWLDGRTVESTWRPIELRTGVYYGNAITFGDGTRRELPRDGDRPTAAVVTDTVVDGGSTLVFVNSRRNAEASARRLAGDVDPLLDPDDRAALGELAESIRSVDGTDTSADLGAVVERGVAFHHAGLTPEHRSEVEAGFRDRRIKAVCATPTLAAGVNTPSRRVVVRDWRRYDANLGGMAPLDTLEVHQMFGRAGRPGLDPYGEAVLLAGDRDEFEELFDRYIDAAPEPVRSKLAAEPALRTHLLATVATGFATSRAGLLDFLGGTLYAVQTTEGGRLESVTDAVIDYLVANGFLDRADGLRATPVGHTVSRLYLDPMSAAEIIDGLTAAAADPPSAFGLYHLVSRTPDMYPLYLRSGDREAYTDLAYEREPEFLGRMPSEFETDWDDWLSAAKTAKLLEDWAEETDESRLTERYGVGPGDLRAKTDTAEWLLNAAERLADELDLEGTAAIRRARLRVTHGVREELLELTGVTQVGRVRARKLYRAGIETRADLRSADKRVVLRALDGRRRTAETVLRNAGRPDPSMEGVQSGGASPEPSGGGRRRESPSPAPADAEDDQASLGDF